MRFAATLFAAAFAGKVASHVRFKLIIAAGLSAGVAAIAIGANNPCDVGARKMGIRG